MVEYDGLGVLWAPILVENLYAVVGRNKAHDVVSFSIVAIVGPCGMNSAQGKAKRAAGADSVIRASRQLEA